MSENMRIQSELNTDLEVYRLKGELSELREQNRVLREALQFYADPQTYGKHGGSVNRVIADGGATAQAALTATSQPAKPAGKMHACDIPGCVSCGNPEDATSQEGQHG